MMDKKSANGLSSKVPESGGQRKQLPYSVETPYGFHLDLDFLKYVDDIEKGNTIKRVHIQRKNRGPKYSTLPRNFSLPGHGARPAAKDIWSNTSTLGSKPKSRVTEVQQIFDFKASDGSANSSIQSSPAPQSTVQSSTFLSSRKPVDEVQILLAQNPPQEQQVLDVRPSLFRASSMPVNVPRRKGSDSNIEQSSLSQNSSTEKLFRPADNSDRRGSIPQDRASLHQQITAALKRVRELEEQVRTIPELKSQICSLREENEKLLQKIQEHSQETRLPETEPGEEPQSESQGLEESTEMLVADKQQEALYLSKDTVGGDQTPEQQVAEAKNLERTDHAVSVQEPVSGVILVPVILIEKAESPDSDESEKMLEESDHEATEPEKPSEPELKTSTSLEDKVSELPESLPATDQPDDTSEYTESQDETPKTQESEGLATCEKPNSASDDQNCITIEELQIQVTSLEERLNQASCELERTNSLLLVQLEINRQKEVTIQDLSEKITEPSAVAETEPFKERVLTCDASVNTDSKSVSEKEVLTDLELQPVDSSSETVQTCCGTQTNAVETRDTEVLAQVTTAEKFVSVEVSTFDKAVETDVPDESGGNEFKDSSEASETKDTVEEVDVEDGQGKEDAAGEEICENLVIERDVAEEYVIVEKTEGDIFGVLDEPTEITIKPSAKPTEPSEDKEVETSVPETPQIDAPTGGASSHQDQKQLQGQDNQTQPQRLAEAPASPAAIGQVVTRIQGLLNEQWASLGSGGQEPKGESSQKQPVSKISTIQSHLRGSLSALSAFYSPIQKGGAAKQSGLKSIMKKNDCPDKQGKSGTKKNLKFVGVNGGYESTSSEESSGEENEDEGKVDEEKEEEKMDSLEPEVQEEKSSVAQNEEEKAATTGEEVGEAQAGGSESFLELKDPQASGDQDEEQPDSDLVDKNFMAACLYLKDRMAEVASPNKEMRQVLMVLYQEWFRVSSQKESQADTVTLYLREVGNQTPTLLRYIVNLADGNGNMALHYSVSHSNFHVVKLLLDTGLCEVNHQNKAGYTAIMLAALTAAEGPEDMEVAQQLLSMGNINARAGQSGQTALMLAVSHGRTSMVQVLLDCKADMNIQDQDGSTALMIASEHGHTDIVKLLLDRPACDTNLTDNNGLTALCVATKKSHPEIIDLLRAHAENADPSLASLL